MTEDAPKLYKTFVVAHITLDIKNEFVQHVRNFDVAHPGCHFEIGIDGPNMPLADMVEAIRIDPELTFSAIFERRPRAHGDEIVPDKVKAVIAILPDEKQAALRVLDQARALVERFSR